MAEKKSLMQRAAARGATGVCLGFVLQQRNALCCLLYAVVSPKEGKTRLRFQSSLCLPGDGGAGVGFVAGALAGLWH